jgi:hypothetical protein
MSPPAISTSGVAAKILNKQSRRADKGWYSSLRVGRGAATPHHKNFLLLRNVLKCHNDEIHDLYSSPNIVRVIKSRRTRWVRHVARMGEGRGAYRILVGRPEGKRPLGRLRLRWEDNIKMDLGDRGIDGANWIRLAQDRVQWRAFVKTAMNLRVP